MKPYLSKAAVQLREQIDDCFPDRSRKSDGWISDERLTADSIIEGTISTVIDAPSVIGGNDIVRTRRVTVSVHASYTDMKFRKKIWERDFSNWGEYTQGQQTRDVALNEAVNKVAEDILLETVSGW